MDARFDTARQALDALENPDAEMRPTDTLCDRCHLTYHRALSDCPNC